MALVVKDRVKVTTTTTGTGTITLGAAASGFQSFAVIGNANQTYYTIVGGSEWEVGIGTYTSSGTTLSRDTVLDSSNAGNKVNFSAGSKDVFVVYPAGRSVMTDFEQTISNKTVITTTQTALQYATSNLPSIKPALLLDFANTEQLDPRITFTRASEGRYYDGKTFAKAEENLLLQSQAWATSPWFLNIGGSVTAVNNAATAPDGTSTATSLTFSAQFGSQAQSVTTISGLSYTFSFWAKRISGNTALHINHFDSTTGANTAFTITNDWVRYSVTVLGKSGGGVVQFGVQDRNASGFGEIQVWGAQLEQRSAVSAYTATTTQPITRYQPQLMTAASGVGRLDHNPVTGASDGFLVEEQRTNLLTYSAQFDNAAWTKTRSSITANTIVAPDGTLTGDKLVEDTTVSNTHVVYAPDYAATNTTLTATVYAKAGERSQFFLELSNFATGFGGALFNLSTGVATNITNAGDYTNTSASISAVGNGWYRCSITTTKGSLNSTNRWIIELYNGSTTQYTGNGYSGIYIWGAQLEAGSFPTSYIPTVAAQVTRSADAASMTGTNFSSWYRPDEGTFYSESLISRQSATAGTGVFTAGELATGNYIAVGYRAAGSTLAQVVFNSVAQADFSPTGVIAANQVFKCALAVKVNDFAVSGNAGAVVTDTSGNLPVIDKLYLGVNVNYLNGTIRKIAFYPARLTNAQLQALTS